MSTRSYNQLCGLAYGLDMVGERWTILVIRELIAGPQRFTDLMNGLPGISTNLLTDRLKKLEQRGLIQRRTLPPPAASTVYELTAVGRGLEKMLLELGRWGSQFIPADISGVQVLHVGSYALTPKTFFRPELAQEMDVVYALDIDGDHQQIHIQRGEIAVQQGQPAAPDVRLTTDALTYLGLLQHHLTPEQAVAAGAAQVDGEIALLNQFIAVCGLPTEG